MKKNLLKSIWAIVAGFIFVVIASILTDLALISTGLMKQPFYMNTTSFILFVIFYRCLYGTTGSYLTARLSPNKPMKHSIIGGVIGFIIAVSGAAAMWSTPPHWYPLTLIVTTLPCAWLGGKLLLNKERYETTK